jgi:hypothetical protein
LTVFAVIGSARDTVTNPAQTSHYLNETKKQEAAETNSASTFASTADLFY